jgi:transcriptional regulator with XRE-family HTH domain
VRIANANTDEAVLRELGSRLERTRLERNRTQAELATEAGIGRATLQRLEAGQPGDLSSFVRVLRALGLLEALDRLVPEPTPSPIELLRIQGRQRARASRPRGNERPSEESEPWNWSEEGEASSS